MNTSITLLLEVSALEIVSVYFVIFPFVSFFFSGDHETSMQVELMTTAWTCDGADEGSTKMKTKIVKALSNKSYITFPG